MINKEMKSADLASVTGGGWKTNLAIRGLCLASGPIGTMICLGKDYFLQSAELILLYPRYFASIQRAECPVPP